MEANINSHTLNQLAGGVKAAVSDTKVRKIFHYTSLEGFYHIIRNRQLYFTDAAFLNDASEAENVFDQLLATLQRCKGVLNQTLYQELLNHMRTGTLVLQGQTREETYRSFVLACSYQKDSLHLWNYYGRNQDHSAGICLGFDPQEMERSFHSLNQDHYHKDLALASGRVIYQDSEKQEILKSLLLGIQTLWEPCGEEGRKELLAWLLQAIRWIGIFYKHRCFEGEEEYRMVVDLPSTSLLDYRIQDRVPEPEQLYKVRLQSQLFAPYIKLAFDPDGIIEVRLSPLADRYEAKILDSGDIQVYGVTQFLRVNGIQVQPEQILRSEIPLRY